MGASIIRADNVKLKVNIIHTADRTGKWAELKNKFGQEQVWQKCIYLCGIWLIDDNVAVYTIIYIDGSF